MSSNEKKSHREKKYKVPNATEQLGNKLKLERVKLKYSLGDAAQLTGFSKATIVDIEKGVTVDINYYIVYAQALYYGLSQLFNIDISNGPRYSLTAKKAERIFLTDNIKKLYTEHDFFAQKQTVGSVALKLVELQIISETTSYLSTRISSVLSSLVNINTLYVVERSGRNKLYLKVNKP